MYFQSAHDSKKLIREHYDCYQNAEQQILIINDRHFIRNMLKIVFENMGYTVITADNGWDGMQQYQANHRNFDMVILDATLSNSGGLALLQEIRGLNNEQKILMITGNGEMQEVGERYKDQQTVFFKLPFSLRKLAKTAAAMING